MKNRIQSIIASFIVAVGLAGISIALPAYAQTCSGTATECIGQGVNGVGGSSNSTSLQDNIKIVTNVLLFLLGAVAVIMIIIGGIRYATSNGDAGSTKAAKDTIMYAVIGLIVAILAYAIVNFIIAQFAKS